MLKADDFLAPAKPAKPRGARVVTILTAEDARSYPADKQPRPRAGQRQPATAPHPEARATAERKVDQLLDDFLPNKKRPPPRPVDALRVADTLQSIKAWRTHQHYTALHALLGRY